MYVAIIDTIRAAAMSGRVASRRFRSSRTKLALPDGLLHAGPVPKPSRWVRHVNAAQNKAELNRLRRSVHRGTPFGSDVWARKTASALGLESTLRPRGRPRQK